MRQKLSLLFYAIMVVGFGTAIYKVLQQRARLQHPTAKTVVDGGGRSSLQQFTDSFSSNLVHPLPTLLLQVIVIVIVVRIFGFLFNKIGQPVVIGEIVAGVVLGPSLLGAFFPQMM